MKAHILKLINMQRAGPSLICQVSLRKVSRRPTMLETFVYLCVYG